MDKNHNPTNDKQFSLASKYHTAGTSIAHMRHDTLCWRSLTLCVSAGLIPSKMLSLTFSQPSKGCFRLIISYKSIPNEKISTCNENVRNKFLLSHKYVGDLKYKLRYIMYFTREPYLFGILFFSIISNNFRRHKTFSPTKTFASSCK